MNLKISSRSTLCLQKYGKIPQISLAQKLTTIKELLLKLIRQEGALMVI